jgi:hypothetical protein
MPASNSEARKRHEARLANAVVVESDNDEAVAMDAEGYTPPVDEQRDAVTRYY